ncbi:AMP-binding protein [uncultured Amnibacterium sp.]|uniref:AMP-binding protein n=1 Tax=uncultured Amnibacterium sp. TaxID=1631851 RepID=UPI0035CB4839
MSTTPIPTLRRPGLSVNWSTIWDDIAAAAPDATVIVWEGERITRGDLEDRAARLGGWLQRQGVGRGDRVACLMTNRPEYLVTLYASMKIGAVPVNLNFRYAAAELRHVLTMTRPKVVVVASWLEERLLEAVATIADPPTVLTVQHELDPIDGPSFDEAVESPRGDESSRSGADQVFLLTGGTTGMPRAVVYRHDVVLDSQLTSAYGTLGVDFPSSVREAVAVATDPALPHPVTLPITPLMHAMAFFNAMNTLLTGGALVFVNTRRFDPALTIDAVLEHRVSRLIIAGDAVAVPLVEELARRPATRLDSLETVMSSGMSWSDRTKRALLDRSGAELIDILGASEGGPFAMARTKDVSELPSRLRLLPGAVLLDESGDEITAEVGRVGLLAYKGATPEGYFEDPARTSEVYRSIHGRRYLVPGDWARWETDGVSLLGRGEAVVNTGGEKVYPAEVEGALAEHPAVADCVVFGLEDARWGEIVVAAVAVRDGQVVTAEQLRTHVGDRLAGFKKPRRISFGPIERGATGKVRLGVLRDRADAERADAEAGPS